MMTLYVFSSESVENVRRGIARFLWAVPAWPDDSHTKARRTRAGQMRVGSAGLFYCADAKIFTTPFVIESEPEDRPVSDVWERTWHLPFKIRPLGSINNSVSWHQAKQSWPFVRDADNLGALVSAARAFAPIPITRFEWDNMLEDLKMNPEDYEDLF